eukprot:328412-Rhodomonas_salina.2
MPARPRRRLTRSRGHACAGASWHPEAGPTAGPAAGSAPAAGREHRDGDRASVASASTSSSSSS